MSHTSALIPQAFVYPTTSMAPSARSSTPVPKPGPGPYADVAALTPGMTHQQLKLTNPKAGRRLLRADEQAQRDFHQARSFVPLMEGYRAVPLAEDVKLRFVVLAVDIPTPGHLVSDPAFPRLIAIRDDYLSEPNRRAYSMVDPVWVLAGAAIGAVVGALLTHKHAPGAMVVGVLVGLTIGALLAFLLAPAEKSPHFDTRTGGGP